MSGANEMREPMMEPSKISLFKEKAEWIGSGLEHSGRASFLSPTLHHLPDLSPHSHPASNCYLPCWGNYVGTNMIFPIGKGVSPSHHFRTIQPPPWLIFSCLF